MYRPISLLTYFKNVANVRRKNECKVFYLKADFPKLKFKKYIIDIHFNIIC